MLLDRGGFITQSYKIRFTPYKYKHSFLFIQAIFMQICFFCALFANFMVFTNDLQCGDYIFSVQITKYTFNVSSTNCHDLLSTSWSYTNLSLILFFLIKIMENYFPMVSGSSTNLRVLRFFFRIKRQTYPRPLKNARNNIDVQ